MGAGADGLVAVHPPRADGPDRGLLVLHHTHLHAAGMGAQGESFGAFHEEGVLHVPGGMLGGEVQRSEVVVVILDLGPLAHGIAKAFEHPHDPLPDQGDGVQASGLLGGHRARGVALLNGGGTLSGGPRLHLLPTGLRGLLQLVHAPAQGLLVLGGHLLEGVEQRGDGPFAAEHGHAKALHFLGRGGCRLGHFRLQLGDAVGQAHSSTRMNMRTSLTGRSRPSRCTAAMRSITSRPSTTSPKTV